MENENKKFKIGEKVQVIKEHDGNKKIINKIGRIIKVYEHDLDIDFEEDIDGWAGERNKWNVPFSKVLKYDDSIKVGDRVRLNKKATIEDFTKNHWNGCQMNTLLFIKEVNDSNEIFVVEEDWGRCVDLKSEETNEEYELVNINILEKIVEVEKEMTIEEISKELGYKIKIKEK